MQRKYNREKEAGQKLKKWLVPKTQQTLAYQKEIKDELLAIKEDTTLLPNLFRIQEKEIEKFKRLKQEAEEKMFEAEIKKKELSRDNIDLLNEVERKKKLSLQAMAARSGIKQRLDEASSRIE